MKIYNLTLQRVQLKSTVAIHSHVLNQINKKNQLIPSVVHEMVQREFKPLRRSS